MTTWNSFPVYAAIAIALWGISAVLAIVPTAIVNTKMQGWKLRALFHNRVGRTLAIIGWLVLVVFTVKYWMALGRPPFRTLGETRLWYAIFLPPIGLIAEMRWGLRWMRAYTLAMAALFVVLNVALPEAHDKSLAPALQSVWFVPHVIVYIVGYAFLGASALVGLHGLYLLWKKKPVERLVFSANILATLGFVCINLGLVFGAFWAKEAWGHYWTWDPKETWAFLTWLAYLVYMHITLRNRATPRAAFLALTLGFAVLLVCWFGMNYLATAAQSVHSYQG